MLKMIALLLSQLILLQSSNLCVHDFSKIQTLIEHAQFHKENYGDSFIEFVLEHYSESDDENIVHHSDHENLPFKQDINHSNFQLIYLSISPTIEIAQIPTLSVNKVVFFYQEPSTNSVLKSLFQPPKFL